MDISDLGVNHHEDWIPLPDVAPPFNLDAWAEGTAAELATRYAAEGEQADVKQLSRDLRSVAEESATREPLGAFAWYVSGFDTSVGLIELNAVLPDETAPEVTPRWMAERFASDDFGPPEIAYTDLPLGPAVRIRQNIIGEKKRLFGSRPVIRTLSYGVQPKGEKGLLVLTCSWTEPVLDEPIAAIVDNMAPTLLL
ncbi:hypothetical protein OH717_12950 [Streptomyces albidoflavus]|uniref:hypothetical protein n=1 Tax=Streptomyces koyangensis TaxID=188770 RepID=UPI003D028BB7|nr:hypothetical protein OH717_12950 [Streptomyces albidoflavus]